MTEMAAPTGHKNDLQIFIEAMMIRNRIELEALQKKLAGIFSEIKKKKARRGGNRWGKIQLK